MNAANLNTMNSYILPIKNDIDPATYSEDSEWKYSLIKENGSRKLVKDSTSGYKFFHVMSSYL